MSDRFAPGTPGEEDDEWTGGAAPGNVTPARGDAAGALAASAPPPGAASTPGGGPPSPYAPGAPQAGKEPRKTRRRRKKATTRTQPAPGATGTSAKGRTRSGKRPFSPRSPKTWIFVGAAVLFIVIRGCANLSEGRDSADGSGDVGSSASRVPVTVDPTPAPSVSAMRGIPADDIAAPEILSQSDLPVGTGYSPRTPAPGREVSLRFPDKYVGKAQVLTLSPLSTDSSSVPSYYLEDFYPDEVLRSVKVHFAPEGYSEGEYPSQPEFRLQGESGRWYEGRTYEYDFDDWAPSTRTYIFAVPEWDLPSDAVVEVDRDPFLRLSFPVYVDVN